MHLYLKDASLFISFGKSQPFSLLVLLFILSVLFFWNSYAKFSGYAHIIVSYVCEGDINLSKTEALQAVCVQSSAKTGNGPGGPTVLVNHRFWTQGA